MIDLHLHTTASDGWLTPAQLVSRASGAGLTTISVTDHDTVAAVADASAAARMAGLRVVPGIEITSVDDGRDVHLLGYFFDPASVVLARFLEGQRALRVSRARDIGALLSALGVPVDIEGVLASAAGRPGSSVGRPQLARALVQAGHVQSVQEAFDRWLAAGQPAFAPRTGPSPAEVVAIVHQAGGVVSFAHPSVTRRDELIAPLVEQGLDAIEVYHSDHTRDDERAYSALASRLGVLTSGGSDFHGHDPAVRQRSSPATREQRGPAARPARAPRNTLGAISLPASAFERLEDRARSRAAS